MTELVQRKQQGFAGYRPDITIGTRESPMTQTETHLRKELENRLRFEAFVARLSARFINLPADQVDSVIEEAQQLVCKALDLDRSSLWQCPEERPNTLLLTHFFQNTAGPQRLKRTDPPSHMDVYWIVQGTQEQPIYERIDVKGSFPWSYKRLQLGHTLVISDLEELPPEAARDKETFIRYNTKSTVVIPLSMGKTWLGCLSFAAVHKSRVWSESLVKQFHFVADLFTNALARKRGEEALRAAYEEIRVLKDKLEAENVYLREEIESISGHGKIVGQSKCLQRVIEQARQVAKTDSTVLIFGETGTGKDLLAHFIHAESVRRDRTLITANLAAMPPTLIENELFGREKGAYTGAMARQIGRFETAHESTIFLDEIGEMPVETQVKILRVLQDGSFERLGSAKTIRVDVRVIAATNRDLAEAAKKGTFRQDLYYRLNVFPIVVPPLRERREDIPLLVWAFVKEFGEKMGKFVDRIHGRDMEILKSYNWPGNIRELRNVIERAMILTKGSELRINLPESVGPETVGGYAINDVEKQHIIRVLETTNGRIGGKGGAADLLGLKPPTLYFRMKRLGIQRKR